MPNDEQVLQWLDEEQDVAGSDSEDETLQQL